MGRRRRATSRSQRRSTPGLPGPRPSPEGKTRRHVPGGPPACSPHTSPLLCCACPGGCPPNGSHAGHYKPAQMQGGYTQSPSAPGSSMSSLALLLPRTFHPSGGAAAVAALRPGYALGPQDQPPSIALHPSGDGQHPLSKPGSTGGRQRPELAQDSWSKLIPLAHSRLN